MMIFKDTIVPMSEDEKKQRNLLAWADIVGDGKYESENVKNSPMFKEGKFTSDIRAKIEAGKAVKWDANVKQPERVESVDDLEYKFSSLSEIVKGHMVFSALGDKRVETVKNLGNADVKVRARAIAESWELKAKIKLLTSRRDILMAGSEGWNDRTRPDAEKAMQGQLDKWISEMDRNLGGKQLTIEQANKELNADRKSETYQHYFRYKTIYSMLANNTSLDDYKEAPEELAVLKQHFDPFVKSFTSEWEAATKLFIKDVKLRAVEKNAELVAAKEKFDAEFSVKIKEYAEAKKAYLQALNTFAEAIGLSSHPRVVSRSEELGRDISNAEKMLR